METVLTESPVEAAEFIKRGGIVAFPTETVYGLGADVFNESAITSIFEAKQRPADNPLIAHVASLDQIAELTKEINVAAEKLIRAFFPGPLTIVLPKSDRVPQQATAGLDTIGIRMPRFEVAHRFIRACRTPVVAPSANLSGRPSPTTWQAVREDLGGRIDCILLGEPTEIGLESTVVDCTGHEPVVLRFGSISIEDLRRIVPNVRNFEPESVGIARSPGMKHRHYSPRARVVLLDNDVGLNAAENSAYIGLRRPIWAFDLTMVCKNKAEYAHAAFEFLRECDRAGIGTIYCEVVNEDGIGAALMDRLRRASER